MKDFQLPSILPTCYLSLPTQPNFLIRLFTLTVSTSLPPTHSLANFNLSSSPDTPLNHSHQGHRILWTLSSYYPIWPLGNSLCVWSLPRCITASLDFWDTTFSWSSSRLGSLLFLLHLSFWVILFMQVVFVTLSMLSTPKCISLVHVSLLISRWLPFATPPSQLPSRHRLTLEVCRPQWSHHVSAFSDTFIIPTWIDERQLGVIKQESWKLSLIFFLNLQV